ncbi:hypothetical protein UY3_09953 [Chelonia mydas]|uniref:Uncharacterized protein n=1 Tax=Chelonia mydas TaxID=8469 RepID=M7BLM4_CHEMY|nr:hypothetical protein UY3_09953 [Chelonia mydas]
MEEKSYSRDQQQCHMKAKELWQVYQKEREANSQSGAEPQNYSFYKELHAILGRDTTTNPKSPMDTSEEPESQAPSMKSEEEDEMDEEEVEEYGGQATGSPVA